MIWQKEAEKVMPILEEFIQNIQNNEKAENSQLLVQHILQWTNGQPELTQAICQLITQSNKPIKTSEGERRVNDLVQTYFIDNWQEQEEASEIRKVHNSIFNNDHKADLLILYKQILQELEISFNNSPKQKELIDTGLIIVQQGKLKSANQIYKSVFNLNWVNHNLSNLIPDLLEQKESQTTLKLQKTVNQRRLLIYTAFPVIFLVIFSSIYFLLSKLLSGTSPQKYGNFTGQVVSNNSTSSKKSYYEKFKDVPNVPQGNFPYGGSTTLAPLRGDDLLNAIKQAHPGFELEYTHPISKPPGSGTGIQQLLKGILSFSHSSRTLKKEELEEARLQRFNLERKEIARDAIAFYVNSKLSIRGLTLSQLRDILSGKITNWREIDSSINLKITLFSRELKYGGTVDFIKKELLEGKDFRKFVPVKNPSDSIERVAKTRGGIAFGSASLVMNSRSVKPLSLELPKKNIAARIYPFNGKIVNTKYPITRPLFVIIKKPIKDSPNLDQQAGEAYVNLILSNEGQKWVKRKGFVPTRIVD